MKNVNLQNVEEAKDFERLPAGGYVCGITAVEDVPDKEYLRIEFDIAEGDFKNYYRDLYQSKSFWGGNFIKSYKDKALPFFKGFVTSVENSNPGYKFDYDESTLKRKFVGLVLGEEEYLGNDEVVKTRLYVAQIHSVDKIREGKFEVPKLKKLAQDNSGFQPVANVNDDDLPF